MLNRRLAGIVYESLALARGTDCTRPTLVLRTNLQIKVSINRTWSAIVHLTQSPSRCASQCQSHPPDHPSSCCSWRRSMAPYGKQTRYMPTPVSR